MSLRALGGGELSGDKLVRLVYFDEAGISNRRHEPFLVVGGVIVHGDHQLNKLEIALEKVVFDHIPEVDRDGFVLHAGDIYGGYGKYFDKRKHPEWAEWERRAAILDDLAAIPEKVNIRAVFGGVERDKFPQTFSLGPGEKPDLTVEAHVCAFMSCVLEVELWHRQHAKQEHCMLIVENNDRAKRLIADTQRYYQDPRIAASFSEKHRKYFPLGKVKEDPAFQKKRSGHPLVMADFIAFMAKRKLMNDPKIDRFCRPWWHRSAGLMVKLPS
jgi:hypothetical protein